MLYSILDGLQVCMIHALLFTRYYGVRHGMLLLRGKERLLTDLFAAKKERKTADSYYRIFVLHLTSTQQHAGAPKIYW